MNEVIEKGSVPFTEVSLESVLLDADLFVKYSSPEKAFQLLKESLDRSPRSIPLREKMRDICVKQKNLDEAARQCLALVSLYIGREDFDVAYDRLQEAKLLDPRISVAPGLEAIGRARLVHDHDVRVVQGRRGARLPLESSHEVRVLGVLLTEDLQRDVATESGVARVVDLSHAPAPQRTHDFVGTERRPRGQDHRSPTLSGTSLFVSGSAAMVFATFVRRKIRERVSFLSFRGAKRRGTPFEAEVRIDPPHGAERGPSLRSG